MTEAAPGNGMRETVHRLMPGLWRILADLVGFWSVSANSGSPMRQTAEKVAGLFRHAGIADTGVTRIEHESRTSAPLVYGHAPGPKGAPTVLLYAHYDVQPADASKWTIGHPFAAKEVDDGTDIRLYGRGAADDKSGIVMHLGAIRAMLDSRLPSRLPAGVGRSRRLYFASSKELWARSYAQAVLARSGDPTLLRALADLIARDDAFVWPAVEFEPVANAIAVTFERLGLLRDPRIAFAA